MKPSAAGTKTILGARIRERRRNLKISQADLARRVGISASYLNLIEHNKRAIAGSLLRRTADALSLKVEELDGAAERRLLDTLTDLAHNPSMDTLEVEVEKAGELIGRYPGWARAVAAMSRAEREASDRARALAERLTHDPFLAQSVHRMLGQVAAVRSAGEILSDFDDIDAPTRQQFHDIIVSEGRGLTEVGEALVTYFERSESTDRVLTPLDEVEALFEARDNHFTELEEAAEALHPQLVTRAAGPRWQRAGELVDAELGALIADFVRGQTRVETELGVQRAEEALRTYAQRALLAPMSLFAEQAESLRYDLEALADVFAVGVGTICHRLIAIPPNVGAAAGDAPRVPRFGYFCANAAGTLLETRNLQGLAAPRYASACPLWVLFRAQQSPETVIRQRALFPDGGRFIFLARARNASATGFGKPRHYLTDMLALSEEDADLTVYAPDSAVAAEPVGTACRSCPRDTCEHRVADPLTG